jgi:hypothetical protein
MTALRDFRISDVHALRGTRRAAPSWRRERAFRRQPAASGASSRRAGRPWAPARFLAVAGEMLFGMWAVAVLGLFVCVAVALVR